MPIHICSCSPKQWTSGFSLQIRRTPGLREERKCFPNTQSQMAFTFFFFRLNFATLTQMHISAECHWDTSQDSQELLLKRSQLPLSTGSQPPSQGRLVWANLCSGLADSISVSLVGLFLSQFFLLLFRSDSRFTSIIYTSVKEPKQIKPF